MAVIGTFGSFTAARLGIYASQTALTVTGNNIANINTEGYTRQRLDLTSIHSYGGIRYANSYNLNIGYGVLTDGVSQLRDPFLDIRYRNANADTGSYEARLDCLQQLASILDEVGKGSDEFGIVERQFNDFLKQLQNLNGKVGSVEYDTTVRGSAQTLTRLLNDYSKAMDTLGTNKLKELKEDVGTVNALLIEIRDLSKQIRDGDIQGDRCLELRDARNVCIDKLSAYMKVDVKYDLEKIDEFSSVERINISIADSGNPPIKLIQGIYGAQISMPEMAAKRNPNFDANNPAGYQYISRDSNLATGDIKYTNNLREALTIGGDAVANERDALEAALIAAKYGEDAQAPDTPASVREALLDSLEDSYKNEDYAPYLIGDTGTWDANKADQVQNALEENWENNRLWMTVEPLVDAKGKYLRDEYHKEIKEPVDLSDTQLYGSLQSMREFLTEKGEFSSDDDLKFDRDAAQKRGLLYYINSLDALARKFADEFNKANQLNIEDVNAAYKQDDNGKFVDAAGKPITFKITITDDDGNIVKVYDDIDAEFFDQLTFDMAKLEALRKQAAGNGPKPAELQELVDTESDMTAELADMNSELADLEAELADLEAQPDPDEAAIAAKNDAIAAKKDAIAAQEKEIEKLTEQIRIARLDPDEAKTELEALEPDVKERTVVAYEAMEQLRKEGQLTDLWSFYNGGVLFSCNGDTNDPTNITARNITISKGWSTGDVRILNTKIADGLSHSTADDNIYHMIDLMNFDFDYFPNEIVDNAMEGGEKRYFTGSFQERLADMNSIMAVDTETTTVLYNNYTITTLSLDNSRMSVSSVDLNDEATNMMMFQKSYAAACQLMTTLDSMLDKLINGTIR